MAAHFSATFARANGVTAFNMGGNTAPSVLECARTGQLRLALAIWQGLDACQQFGQARCSQVQGAGNFDNRAERSRGLHCTPANGSTSHAPVPAKSPTLRVTTANPCSMAVAAIIESRNDRGSGTCSPAQL